MSSMIRALCASALLVVPVLCAADTSHLVVTGTGRATAAPDRAELRVGVSLVRATAAAALEEASRDVRGLRQVLTDAGIADKDVQTVRFQVAPQQAPPQRGGQPGPVVGYRVVHLLSVGASLADLGGLIDRLVAGGANVLESVQFVNRDPAPMLDEARRRAVEDGARRAQVLAQAAGRALGPLVSLREGAGRPPPTPFLRAESALVASVPIAPGENEYRATVTLEYELH